MKTKCLRRKSRHQWRSCTAWLTTANLTNELNLGRSQALRRFMLTALHFLLWKCCFPGMSSLLNFLWAAAISTEMTFFWKHSTELSPAVIGRYADTRRLQIELLSTTCWPLDKIICYFNANRQVLVTWWWQTWQLKIWSYLFNYITALERANLNWKLKLLHKWSAIRYRQPLSNGRT